MSGGTSRFHVFTGGPGAGKTTLVDALATEGFAQAPEAGRAVIREQVATGGSALPWADRLAFAREMLRHDLASHAAALKGQGPVLFDRGLVDIIGYLKLEGLAVPAEIDAAARKHRYSPYVLIAPPWPEIFANDAERKQSLGEAERTFDAMVATYLDYGYDLIELPRATVAERAAFVRARVG